MNIFRSLFHTTLTFVLFWSFFIDPIEIHALSYEEHLVKKIDIVIMTGQKEAVHHSLNTHEGEFFSQTKFDQDLKNLTKNYDRVEPRVEIIDGQLTITLRLWAKPTIRSIKVTGNTNITQKEVQKELGITSCSTFDRAAFNKAFNTFKTDVIKKGYFESELDYEIVKTDKENEIDIIIHIREGRAGRIKNICFINFTDKEQEDIVNLMVTKTYNRFLSWLTEQGTYHEDAMQYDQLQITNYLQNKGYADAQVFIKVCESDQPNRININITAEKGTLYCINRISFTGNVLFTDDQIFNEFLIVPGDPYSPELLLETTRNIMNLYGRKGYIDAIVNFVPTLNEDTGMYEIDVTIEEGEQYHVGLVKVFGNCTTHSRVILHETLLVPGQIFNLDRLQSTEERLRNTGYFKNVNVYAVRSEGLFGIPGNFRDVHIEVEEQSTGNIGLFLGYSSQENLFGGINITEKNFNIRGLSPFNRNSSTGLRGEGEYLSLNGSLGQKSTSAGLSWTKPYFRDTQWSVGFDLDWNKNRYISNDYDITTIGLTLRTSKQCNPFVRVGYHYRLTHSDIDIHNSSDSDDCEKEKKRSPWKQLSNMETEANRKTLKPETKPKKELTPEQIKALEEAKEKAKQEEKEKRDKEIKEAEDNSGIVSAIGANITYDSTNHPTDPTCGFRSRLEGEIAGFGGKQQFISAAYLNTYYYPIKSTNWIIKYRCDFRFLLPIFHTTESKIPLDEKFFLGGEDMLRGYRAYRLGPTLGDKSGDPAGGISLQYYSVEFNRPIFGMLDVFAYADGGFLGEKTFEFGFPYMSIGVGARIKIFPGGPPIMVGYGWPLKKDNDGQVQRFFFQVGGRF